jgi:hypothetical protein
MLEKHISNVSFLTLKQTSLASAVNSAVPVIFPRGGTECGVSPAKYKLYGTAAKQKYCKDFLHA